MVRFLRVRTGSAAGYDAAAHSQAGRVHGPAPCRAELVVLAVAARAVGAATDYHGAKRREAGGDDGYRGFDHGDSASQHCFVHVGVICSNDW